VKKAEQLRLGGQRAKNNPASDAQRDALFFKERERVRVANAEKTTRLKNLRLQKEAAEKAAAIEKAASAPPKPPSRARKVAEKIGV